MYIMSYCFSRNQSRAERGPAARPGEPPPRRLQREAGPGQRQDPRARQGASQGRFYICLSIIIYIFR